MKGHEDVARGGLLCTLDMYLPYRALQYLSSRISPARVPLCSLLHSQNGPGRGWKTRGSFASDLLCDARTCCHLRIKDSPSLVGWNHPP